MKSEAEKAKKIKDIEDKYFVEISESIDKTLSELKKKIDKNPDILSDDAFTIWKPKVDEKLIEATYKALMEAWLRGISHRKDGDSSDFADISLSFDLKYEDAIKIAGLKEAVTPKEYKNLSARIKQQAFTVGRLAQLDMVKKAKSVYLKAIDADKVGDIESFIRDMATVDSRASGMVGYYSLVYRTNIQSDYNAAKALSMEEDPPKYLQFVAIEDERTTEICSARAGITLPYDDPFWKSNWPPLHYNCRSTVRELDEEEVEAMGLLKNGRFKGRKPDDMEVPQSTFGHKPTKEDTEIWSMSRSQAKRVSLDSLNDELNQVAKETTCSDFSEDKEGYIIEATDKGGLRYQNGTKDDAIAAAKTLVENEGCFIEIGSSKAIINGSDTIEIVTSSSLTSKAIASEITKAFSRSGNVIFSVSKENKEALKKAMKSIQKKIPSIPSAKRLYIIIEGRSLLFLPEDLGDTDKLSLL